MSRSRSDAPRLWQVVLLVLLAWRAVGFAAYWSQVALNMDLAAYYTAGKAMNAGLDPYRNQVVGEGGTALWDGVALYRHSRFLYPPLVGHIFRPLALLPFPTAKAVWAALELAALLAALSLFARAAHQKLLPALLFALASHPLLLHLERGQIDLVTLALLGGALWLLVSRPTRWRQWSAGACVALATLLKLPCLLVVPFLALRRRWHAVAGWAATVLVLVALDGVLDRRLTAQYYSAELPRILRFGEKGPADALLPEAVRRPLEASLASGRVEVAGAVYQLRGIVFPYNASLARELAERFCQQCAWLPLAVFAALLGLARAVAGRGLLAAQGSTSEMAYFLAACLVALLASPLTWAMNTVWLFPGVFVLSALHAHTRHATPRNATAEVGTAAAVLGLVLLAIPDRSAFPLLLPPGTGEFLDHKYVAAALLLFIACSTLLRLESLSTESPAAPSQPTRGEGDCPAPSHA